VSPFQKKRPRSQPAPKPDPKPTPTPKPTPKPVPPTVHPITRTTPFRSIGTLSAARVCEIVDDYPLESECRTIGELQANALALAQAFKESQYGKTATGKNPLGLMVPGSSPSRLMTFPSWATAFVEWQRRMSSPDYAGGVYMPQDMSLEQMIYTYVGGPGCWSSKGARCANGETKQSVELYLQQTIDRLNRYFGTSPSPSDPAPTPSPTGYRDHAVAGSRVPLRLPVGLAFKQQLTPLGPNRSGRHLNWTGTTQHTTNNVNIGADAQMHANWQNSGTPGHPDGKIGVHFYVDDERVIQTIPIDEQGVHAGDWRNQSHTSVELCVNADRNPQRAEANAVALQAGLLHILGKSGTEAMFPHTNGGHCPRLTVPWTVWEQRVDQAIVALG
jgi:hypothetical protein